MKVLILLPALLTSWASAVSFHKPGANDDNFLSAKDDLAQIGTIDDRVQSVRAIFQDQFEKKHVVPSSRDIEQRDAEINRLNSEKAAFYNAAILHVVAAYGISPEKPVASIVRTGKFYPTGVPARWQPVYGNLTPHRIRGLGEVLEAKLTKQQLL